MGSKKVYKGSLPTPKPEEQNQNKPKNYTKGTLEHDQSIPSNLFPL